jgi:hypothetical protein
MNEIIVEDLCSDDEGTLVKTLKDLRFVHLDPDRDDFQEMQGEFIEYGGHLAVSWIMTKHPNCKGIQENGISVVRMASYRNTKNEELLGKTRAIHVVYSAMQRFQQDTNILKQGFVALGTLTRTVESNCKILVEELDAIPFLTVRMSSTANNSIGVKWACSTLRNISTFPQLRPRVIQAKAITALGHVIENYETDEEIQLYSKKALALLLSEK